MSDLPKIKQFKTPEGYFERLPDSIMKKIDKKKSFNWIPYVAAAAMLIISFGLWQFNIINTESSIPSYAFEEEVNLYIESQYWTVEDILSMTDNPNEILDQIIDEELMIDSELLFEEEQFWY